MTTLKDVSAMPFDDPIHTLANRIEAVNFTIWWLDSPVGQGSHGFLYGYVVPSHCPTNVKWSGPDKVAEASFNDSDAVEGRDKSGKRRIVRRSITVEGRKANAMLQALISGRTLREASVALGVSGPDINADQPLMSPSWTRLPTVFFPTAVSQTGFGIYSRGRASLTDSAGCYCTSFASPNKFEFLKGETQPDNILRWTAAILKDETGIEFANSGGDAFGNLEVFDFPSLDERDRCRIVVRKGQSENESRGVVLLKIIRPDEKRDYVAEIRTELLSAVSSDQLVLFDGGTDAIQKEIPWPVDGILVRVWEKRSSHTWILWHEHEEH